MKLTPFKKLAFVLGASIMLQGCVAAVVGGAAAGAKVATDPRTMGTQVDDETLEIKVENALDKDACKCCFLQWSRIINWSSTE